MLGVALAERRDRRAAQLLGARLGHIHVAQAVQTGGVDAVAAVPLDLLQLVVRAAFHEARRDRRVRARNQLRDRRRARRRAAFGHSAAERCGAQVHRGARVASQRVAPNTSGGVLRDRLRQRQRVCIYSAVGRMGRLRGRGRSRRSARRRRVYFGGTRRCVRHSLAIVHIRIRGKGLGILRTSLGETALRAIQLNY